MDVLLALASALITAFYFAYISQVMKANKLLSSTALLSAGHLAAALVLLPVWLASVDVHSALSLMTDHWTIILSMAALLAISRELYFYAYSRTDIANVTAFSALTPIYTLAFSFFLLGEFPSLNQFIGMLLICGSIYALFLSPETQAGIKHRLLQPFMLLRSSRAVRCAFLATIPTAYAATLQKKLLLTFDVLSVSLILLFFVGTLSTASAALSGRMKSVAISVAELPMRTLLISALCLPLMHLLLSVVMLNFDTSVALTLQRLSILFQIILGYFYLKERIQFKRRMLLGTMIIIGFCLIVT